MQGKQEQAFGGGAAARTQGAPVQRSAGDAMRGAVRGMSFAEGASAMAPVQQKAVQMDKGSKGGGGPSPEPGGGGGGGGGQNGNITAPTISLNAASIGLNAASTQASGVLRADTIVANNIIGTNYTNGAGNIW